MNESPTAHKLMIKITFKLNLNVTLNSIDKMISLRHLRAITIAALHSADKLYATMSFISAHKIDTLHRQ